MGKRIGAAIHSKNQKERLTSSANQNIPSIPRARRRGASRSSRNVGHGMRWTLRRQAGSLAGRTRCSVRRSRVVLAPRPWRYAGGESRRQRGQERPLPRGEHL